MQETRNEKQVAKKQEAGLPSDALFEADAKKGFENVDPDSLALPDQEKHRDVIQIMLMELNLVCFLIR